MKWLCNLLQPGVGLLNHLHYLCLLPQWRLCWFCCKDNEVILSNTRAQVERNNPSSVWCMSERRAGVTEDGGEAGMKTQVSGWGISHYTSPWTPQTVVRTWGSKSHEDFSRCGHDLNLALTFYAVPCPPPFFFFLLHTCLNNICWLPI